MHTDGIEILQDKIDDLKEENKALQQRLAELEAERDALREKNIKAIQRNTKISEENIRLYGFIIKQENELISLRQRLVRDLAPGKGE